ncbi:DUF3261 domain-containing protein [Pseudidiomarina salinarum]|nr:DUF3261 domain-containing protein [Pseudidiomarina salinarum]
MLIQGCQLAPDNLSAHVALTKDVQLQLLKHWPHTPVQQLHQVTWSHPAYMPRTMLVTSALDVSRVLLIGLSPLGQELWRVKMTPGSPLQTSGLEPFNQPQLAKAVVADMQLHQWPVPSLQQQLKGGYINQISNKRTVINAKGDVIWLSTVDVGGVVIENIAGGYTLRVVLLEELKLEQAEQDH